MARRIAGIIFCAALFAVFLWQLWLENAPLAAAIGAIASLLAGATLVLWPKSETPIDDEPTPPDQPLRAYKPPSDGPKRMA